MALPSRNNRDNMALPASYAEAVTPSDSTDLPNDAKSLYIGGAGDVKVTTIGGEVCVFTAHPIGYMPVHVSRVWNTGTTATHIVGLSG